MCLKALALSLLMLSACLLPCALVAALATAQNKGDNDYARTEHLKYEQEMTAA